MTEERPYIVVSRRRVAKAISMHVTLREWLIFWRARWEGNRHMRRVYAERRALREDYAYSASRQMQLR